MLPPTPPPGSRVITQADRAAAQAREVNFDDNQLAVIHCHDKTVVAEAKAGAGKTTVAVAYAAARPYKKHLYLCLNTANAKEAAGRFGANTTCKTIHSVAYAAVGHKFRDQLVKGGWRPRQFADEARLPGNRIAAVVQGVLNGFFSSRDTTITASHVDAIKSHWDLTPAEQGQAMDLSRLVWQKMQKPGSGISIPHDAYLKIWALSKPKS